MAPARLSLCTCTLCSASAMDRTDGQRSAWGSFPGSSSSTVNWMPRSKASTARCSCCSSRVTCNRLSFAPGVLLGIEARAKILAGLIGFSFSVEVMAQIQRQAVPREEIVTISAQIHVAASVHVAIFLDEDVHFETQFQQDIPLATLGLLPGVGLLVAPALIPL